MHLLKKNRVEIKLIEKLLLRLYIKFHDFSYRQISKIVTKLNNNIHPKHEIMKYYQYFLENIEQKSKILDIGCGNGFLTKKIAEKAKYIVGIDIDKKNIDFAKRNHNKENIRYIYGDITKYNFQENFDVIILSNVLEHIKDRKNLLDKVKGLGNIILIRVPLITRSWLSIYKKQLGLEYRLDDTHYIEYSIDSFKREIKSVGLNLISIQINFGEIWAKISTL